MQAGWTVSPRGPRTSRAEELRRLRTIAKHTTAKAAAEALGITPGALREWLCRDRGGRLAVAVRYAERHRERQRQRLLREHAAADVARVRVLESRLFIAWVERYGTYYSKHFGGFGAEV